MNGSDNEKILHLRNTISLCVDDLTALVVNSALADSLREFSDEVMELTPGFAFGLKQARKLKDETMLTLRQYQARAISDGDLMNYIANARKIIKDEIQPDGGVQMILKNLFQRKEQKQQENLENMQREYRDICDQIQACEEKMNQCIEASRGHSPDSIIYRENERAFNTAKKQMILLHKQETMLSETLSNVDRLKMIDEFNQRQKRFAQYSQMAFGNERSRERAVAQAELLSEKLNAANDKMQGYGNSLFEEPVRDTAQTDSEFGSLVAASERRHSLAESAGPSGGETEPFSEEHNREFAGLTSENGTDQGPGGVKEM